MNYQINSCFPNYSIIVIVVNCCVWLNLNAHHLNVMGSFVLWLHYFVVLDIITCWRLNNNSNLRLISNWHNAEWLQCTIMKFLNILILLVQNRKPAIHGANSSLQSMSSLTGLELGTSRSLRQMLSDALSGPPPIINFIFVLELWKEWIEHRRVWSWLSRR